VAVAIYIPVINTFDDNHVRSHTNVITSQQEISVSVVWYKLDLKIQSNDLALWIVMNIDVISILGTVNE